MKSPVLSGIPLVILMIASMPVLSQTDSITDLEGNVYKTVVIGTQWWMAENLKATKFNNGEEIPFLKDATDWANDTEGGYCYYANRSSLMETYGNLYNWYTVADERELCPSGWHVPSDDEWITLEKHLGMSESEAVRMTAWRGTTEGTKLKDESFGGNNSSGFTALASGYRDPKGVFKAMGTDNDYWTSTPYENQGNTEGVLHGLLNSNTSVVRNFHVPAYGFCIRCVRDEAVSLESRNESLVPKIFPNPAGDKLFVRNANGNQLTIRNLSGMTVLTESVTSSDHRVDMSNLSEGTYLVSISDRSAVESTRVLVF